MKKTTFGFIILLTIGIGISCDKGDDTNNPHAPTVYEGWTLKWNEEFNKKKINLNNWNHELGDGTAYGLPVGWGNNEKQIYTSIEKNSKIIDDEGASVLAITALKGNAGSFTSAKLTTQKHFSMRFGRIEIRAKMPKGQGLLPAIWMLGDNKDKIDWPGCGEIDIAEVLGNNPSKLYSTVHYTNGENKQGEIQKEYDLPTGDFSDAYHIFRLDWTPESLTFGLDGKETGTILIKDDMKEFLRGFYLILNVAVGGNWPGEPTATTVFPQTLYTDYIRVYSKNHFEAPDAPALNIEEETIGQILEPNIGNNAIKDGFNELGNSKVVVYGPGAPNISTSETAIDGDVSLVFDFSGEKWGGAYLELEKAKDISTYTNIKFSLNKPNTLTNAEIKLEAGATNAAVFLKDYTGTDLTDGFVEYSIPLTDFAGLDLTGLTIPFSIWNPKDASDALVKATVLIDNVHFIK